jgi:hypothetical protein
VTDPRVAIVRGWFANASHGECMDLRDDIAVKLLRQLDALTPNAEELADCPECPHAIGLLATMERRGHKGAVTTCVPCGKKHRREREPLRSAVCRRFAELSRSGPVPESAEQVNSRTIDALIDVLEGRMRGGG